MCVPEGRIEGSAESKRTPGLKEKVLRAAKQDCVTRAFELMQAEDVKNKMSQEVPCGRHHGAEAKVKDARAEYDKAVSQSTLARSLRGVLKEEADENREKILSGAKYHYTPNPGTEWNPLLSYGRNEPCPCDSGKKFKNCHLDSQPSTLPIDEARKVREMIRVIRQLQSKGASHV